MPAYAFHTVDVFTERRFGGNPLAVFPAAAGLDTEAMQALAREFNLSETAFVLPPEDPAHTARVRIFGLLAELPFAGHPNVGTAFVLAQQMDHPPAAFVFEEPAGLVRVELLRGADGAVTGAEVAAPRPLTLGAEIPPAVVAACAGLDVADIATAAHPPRVASVGMPFVIAELCDPAALDRARPDLAAFRAAQARYGSETGLFPLHLYTHGSDGRLPGRLQARMFAPLEGVMEDPATGSANAALAALLLALAPPNETAMTCDITQGIALGRPSRLIATAQRTADGAVRATVAGSCVPVLRGEAQI